ncbi:MAG: OB-fold nucleic acid binding domain-containing protein [Methanosphaera sp.]|uniref:DHH family phosphoesterase n=1 Tax=Methanosphaera sp. TaxID=2666342 RepID=UPI0025CE2AAC|nr:OB-fold nucleic acid binding domain-containing protein [Methanosphaera sp.]MCI5866565.1 OB-fold nucleic acid binding domain-containing protein [Methanosphaera sp.]MDD6535042.1 OB-fold nucleic acid binding domain-containing protein [Methanosphaera sp.]MDY3955474.1 OB-fold nucleic acid binding domain-containing protein [Methanosphaera sp.]
MSKSNDTYTKPIVYVLNPSCQIEDLEIGSDYEGVITRVEKYGFFVSLSKSVYGLLRTRNPKEKVGDKVVVKISEIKPHKGKMDVDLGYSKTKYGNDYETITVKRNIKKTKIEDLSEDIIGRNIAINGEIIQIQQTSGPTIFTVRDETDITWAAAFNEPGVRMYPELEVDDVVEILGEVSLHSGKIQIESESIEKLDDDEAEELRKSIDLAVDKKSESPDTSVMIESEVLDKLRPKLAKAAKAIRRAIYDGRSILVRHHADADGICSGIAVEQAVLPLLREESNDADAEWHFFKRSPSKAPFYELEDVVKDLSFALEDQERHGQKLPLLVLLDNGSTEEDVAALRHSKVFGIESVVVDHHYPGEVEDGRALIDDYVDIHVNPYLVGGDSQLTAGALAVELAGMINPDIRDKIRHFPAIAAVGDHAECSEVDQYLEIAKEEGYSRDDLDRIATCVDFEAYFLRFNNGRGIMNTLLGLEEKERQEELVDILMAESDKRVDTQLKAAFPNVETVFFDNGIQLNRLDVEKYAHKFTYPAPGKTTGYVHDKIVQQKGEDQPIMTLANGPDFAVLRATEVIKNDFDFNLNNVITKIQQELPQAGADGGGHEVAGSLKFVEGLRDEVLELFIKEVKDLNRD